MLQTKTNRKTFLQGLGFTAIASFFLIRKKNSPGTDSAQRSHPSAKLPLVARKAPRAIARGNRMA